jgi:hypothetical protein
MAAGIDFNMYNLGAVNHKLRLSGAEELDGATDSIDAHLEVGYLCGLWKRSKAGYLSASLGLSVVETTFRGKEILAPTCFLTSCSGGVYEITKSMTIGLPFHLEAVLMRNIIGIGISILGNMNLDRSYGGVVIEIPLGWLPL